MAGRFSVEAVFKAVDRITAPVTRMQNRIGKMTRSISRGLNKMNKVLGKFNKGLAFGAKKALKFGAVGLGAIATGVTLLIREFSKIENAEAAFTPLLGGAKRARQAVQALNDTAASTPFQFETLAKAAGQLLPVMSGDIELMIKTVRMLGDTAGGNAQKLDSITRGFTKAMLKGKVDMESLNMIAEAGVPIFQDLAAVMGVEVNSAFFKMISAGKVTTGQLTKAFEKMTSKGGKFFNGMDIASKTTTGLWSTFRDNISLTAAEIGGVLAPTIKDLIKSATQIAVRLRAWVKQNRELISKKFVEFVQTIKNVVDRLITGIQDLNKEHDVFERLKQVLTAVADAIIFLGKHGATILKVTAAIVALSLVLKTFSVVMGIVNLVMAANPIGLIIIGIAALIAVVAALVIWWDDLVAAFMEGNDTFDLIVAGIGLLMGPIGWLTAAAALIIKHWDPIKEFFADLWEGVTDGFSRAFDFIKDLFGKFIDIHLQMFDKISSIGTGVASFFGFGGDEDESGTATPQVVTPQDRTARTIDENRTVNTAEVTIRDESGRAEVTSGTLGNGLKLQSSGAF